MSESTTRITVAGAGAYIPPAGETRRRNYARGAFVTVDADLAERLIADGQARAGEVELPHPSEPVVPVVQAQQPAAAAAAVMEALELDAESDPADVLAALETARVDVDVADTVRDELGLDPDADAAAVLKAIDERTPGDDGRNLAALRTHLGLADDADIKAITAAIDAKSTPQTAAPEVEKAPAATEVAETPRVDGDTVTQSASAKPAARRRQRRS